MRIFWCGKTAHPYEGALLASFTPFNKSLSRRYIALLWTVYVQVIGYSPKLSHEEFEGELVLGQN